MANISNREIKNKPIMKLTLNPITGKLDAVAGSAADTESAAFYTSSEPTTEAHGGIEAGATFDREPVSRVLDRILHKPQPPKILSVGASSSAGTYEIGTVLIDNVITAQIKPGTSPIVTVELLENGNVAETLNTEDVTARFTVSIDKTVAYSVRVTAADGRSATSATLNFRFTRPVFYGLIPPTGEPGGVSGLTKTLPAKDSGELTARYEAFDDKRFALALRGTVSKALNPSLFDITRSLTMTTVKVKCLDGQELDYSLYLSEPNSQAAAYPVRYTYALR